MTIIKLTAMAVACAVLGACASTDETKTAQSAATDVQCIKQAPTGSHITRNDCRTAEQREQAQKDADEYLRRQRGLEQPTGPTN